MTIDKLSTIIASIHTTGIPQTVGGLTIASNVKGWTVRGYRNGKQKEFEFTCEVPGVSPVIIAKAVACALIKLVNDK
jgi:hypothetical protein